MTSSYLDFINLYQFNQLSETEQELALREAALLDDREEGDNTVYLFQLGSFYVEVYCHKADPSLNRYRSFSSVNQLEPYLKKIKIEL